MNGNELKDNATLHDTKSTIPVEGSGTEGSSPLPAKKAPLASDLEPMAALEQIDFSEFPSEEQEISPQFGKDYDPRPQEDQARRHIAYALIGLLWVVVGGVLILLAFKVITVDETKEFGVIMGPIVTLVSAATGFYYGTKAST